MLKRHSSVRQAPASRTTSIEPITMRILDAAKFTGLSRSKIYVLIGEGKVQTVKVGRVTLVLTASLKSFLLGGGEDL
jgi:excisionase family DNA binding protein